MSTRRLIGLVTGWQVVASSCYYAIFSGTVFIRETFGISRFLVGVLVTAMTLGYTLFLFPSGAIVDAYGEQPVLVGGLVALGAGAIAVSVAPTVAVLFVGAFALGSAYASAMPASNRAIVAGVPSDSQGVALGLKQVGVTAGSGLSAVVVVTLAPAVATWELGMAGLGVSAFVVAGVFAVSYTGEPGNGTLKLPDIAGLRANEPYVALVLAGFFLGAALFTTVGYLTLYLTESIGVSAGLAGLGFVLLQVAASTGRIFIGGLANRFGRWTDWSRARTAATLLAGQAGVGAVLLGAFTVRVPRFLAFLLVAGVGFTIVGFTGLYYACMSALVDEEEVGAATAGGQTTLNAGALVAPPAFGWLADALSYRASWGLLTGSVVLGTALLALVVWRTK